VLICPTARLCESYYFEPSAATIVRELAALVQSSGAEFWICLQIIRPNTYLFMNCSRACFLSSMKESSNMPSSPRKGSWRRRAFPGRGGTTTWKI